MFNECSLRGTDLLSTTTVALVKVTRKAAAQPKGIHSLLAEVGKQVASVTKMEMVPVSSSGSARMSRCDKVPRTRRRTAFPPMLYDKTISKVKLF